uniref:TIAM Rac1 associated GEF 1 n=1 Tax=Pipistrellus kuhlii TaxID=59472 RepID=A0A7J7R4E7_PIPKU|nr:TIAM Rac1 associated GEF 1 [Pipistrellus kuhlii]
MGNAESQSVEHAFYGEKRASLGRKHTSRSLRLSHKARRSRHSHAATGKAPPRRAEASARSSSTPSLPQALAENGLEPFAAQGALEGFGDPLWADRVEMGLRPVSYTGSSVAPSVDSSVALATTSVQSMLGSEGGAPRPAEGGRRPRPCACPAPGSAEAAGFQKKRSKSADLWREDSLELSLSDLSQEPLSSREDILGAAGERDGEEARAGPRPLGACPRATSLGDLGTPSGGRCAGHCRDLAPDTPRRPHRAEEAAYSAYNTLPCRRSHCLSEGATGPPLSLGSLQGRRARTAQDVNAGEGSEFADSGIEGAATDPDLLSRRSNATHSSYSPPPGRAFAGSDSGSSSAGDAARQGVYENFRRELELGASRESPEEAGSAHSDERSSGRSDGALQAAARGTVRKAGALAVKNLLVHKKSRKVEPAARRRWKHYWAALRGCTLLFYDSDGRSGIEPGSVPKHAVWVENGVVQAVPEHPKKDFVFCLSNCLGDAFLFQTTSQTELENWVTAIHSACSAAVARHHHKEDTLRLLKSEIKKLEQKIDMDEKMKKMGEMQLSSVTDSKKKKTILDQIFVWEQNLEQFQMDLFRYRCYLASLQGGELPNPKRLLAFASRPTKVAMGRLGIFSVSSFHALVAARTAETGVRRRTQAMAHSTSKRRSRSPKSRKDLLKAVHSVLRDKHRRQLLKAESLPSSQQYVPFGGRRLCALKGARPAMSRAVSAPSRSLGRRRRRLARNRFTVDADAVPGSPERPPGADTDRWVEEQFDLAPYEEPEEPEDLPETDILSDDDGEAAEAPGAGAGLAGRLQAASLGPRGRLRGRDPDRDRGRPDGHAARMAQLRKQAALPGGPEPAGPEVVWVRREELASPGALSTEI